MVSKTSPVVPGRSRISRRTLLKGAAATPVAASAFGAPAVSKRSASAQEEANLVVLTHWGAEAQLAPFQALLDEYQEANPNVTIEYQTVAFGELLNRITTGQLGGDAPDVYHFYNLWLPEFAMSQLLATPPDDVLSDIQAGYAEGTISGASFGGDLWGYPTEVNVWQLLYNRQMLADAGIETPPATWDELREVAAQLTQRDGDEVTIGGLELNHTWDSAVVHPWVSLLWSNGGEYVADDFSEVLFNGPAGVETLQLQVDMLTEGSALATHEDDDLFMNGLAAMIFMPNFWGSDLRAGMQGGIENVGVAPIPASEGNQSTAVQYEWLWGVSEGSANQEAAWAFLQWLNSPRDDNPENSSPMGDFLTSALNAIPGRTTDQEAHASVIEDPFVGPFVESLQTSRPEPLIPGAQEIKTNLQTQIEAAWFGQKSPEDALDDAANEANRILAERA
jgi:multiple sugar transport system substrate-binding protein